jgi:hypothetical protein
MKSEEQIGALAKLDGKVCRRCKGSGKYLEHGKHEWFRMCCGIDSPYKGEQPLKDCDHLEHEGDYFPPLPPYLTSYDAIFPLIQKHTNFTQCRMGDWLFEEGSKLKNIFDASPRQLAEALLRATGKWT